MPRLTKNLFIPVIILFLAACAGKKNSAGEVFEKVDRKKTPELVAALDSLSRLRPKYFYSKIKCDFSDTNQKVSFKTSIRMVRDSVVNPLITYASIPIVNALIRPDSLIVTNKREKCVIRQNVGFIKEQFGVDFDFRNIEELFLGLPVGFDTNQRYFQINDPYNYIISSHKKRIIRKETRNKPDRDHRDKDKDKDKDRERDRDRNNRRGENNAEDEETVILRYYLSGDLKTIRRIYINSPNDSTTVDINYLSRDSVENYSIPNEVSIDIVTPRNHLVLQMDYEKSEVNVPQDIHFVIPESYEECGIKEEED